MKKVSSNYPVKPVSAATLLLSFVSIGFLFQGCCFLPQDISKTPCNCGNNKPAYAVNNRNKPAKQEESSKPGTVIRENPSEQVIITGQALTNKINQLPAKQSEPAVPVREAGQPGFTSKKLPLGIKGIRSQIIAGPNMSFKSSEEDYGNTDHKHKPGAGFQLGFGSTFIFSKKFSVSTALIFKKNNAKEVLNYSVPGGGSGEELTSKYSFSYLSIPVMAELRLTDQLTAMAGPEINLLTGATVKSSGYGETEKTDIKDNSVKTGIGLQAGVKYAIPGSPLALQLIYDHRLSRLNEKNESEYYPGGGGGYETPAWRMKGLQLGLLCDLCNLLKKK